MVGRSLRVVEPELTVHLRARVTRLDVHLAVTCRDEFADSKYRPCPLLKELVAAGRFGRKGGREVFSY
ncbi:MAG: 3-hydroxyacyl-CoA dehydrogenase family protein [Xanthobacteraceae bacterium]